MDFDEACEERDKVLDQIIALKEYQIGTFERFKLTQYIAFGQDSDQVPVKFRKAQERVLSMLGPNDSTGGGQRGT